MPSAWGEPPSTVTVYPSGSRFAPVVLVDTVRLPSAGADAGCTATPESVTLWLPAARLVNERLPLIPIAWPGPPSTATVYPSGSRFEPVVLVDTVRLPSAGAVPGFSASTVASQVPGELGEKFQV